jgi:hypothetical protein
VWSGRVTYVTGDRRVTGHTFINSGAEPVNVVATVPSRRRDYTEVGPNPLFKRQ